MTGYAERLTVSREQFPVLDYLQVLGNRETDAAALESKRRYSFFWARNAIYYALQALGISRGAHILVPSYVCTAAVEPIAAFGAEVEFYGVGHNCEPDFAEIESRIRPESRAILAVHYFGFPQRMREFRELCDRRRLTLIEDCAHVLAGSADGRLLGQFGDASVFSWRKCLPLYDGAELRLNRDSRPIQVPWNKETLPFTLKVAKSLLDRFLEQSSGGAAKAFSAGMNSFQRLWRKASHTPADRPLFALDSNQSSFDEFLLNQPFSRVSRWLLAHSQIGSIVKKRRENYLFLHEAFRGIRGIQPLHDQLPENVCPWVFPVFFEGLPEALANLRQEGIPAATWGGVRPAGLAASRFSESDFLYDNLIFLPVHQNLRNAALQRIAEVSARIAAAKSSDRSPRACVVG
jgi:perosamine synthetase